MIIHHVESRFEDRWVLDPTLGAVKRREEIVRPSGARTISHGGETYDIDPQGHFEVPDEVGAYLCRLPGWHSGLSPFPPENLEEDTHPGAAPGRARAAKKAAPKA